MTELRAFEDIAAGEVHEAGPILVTREAIIAFAQIYDPQPFHLDEAAAAGSLLGGLSASGWHTAALGMRLFHDSFVSRVISMGSPGLEEVRWTKPVRPGDQLRMTLETTSVRPSASKFDRGFVGAQLQLRNELGEAVMTQRFTVIVQRRGATQSGAIPPPPAPANRPALPPDADLMLAAPYDEIAIGHDSVLGFQLFTPELIVAFASVYDPQYFHLDAEAARDSHFGGLCASGWQTAAFWMKHYLAACARSAEARSANALPVSAGGPSPGFTQMKWLQPVHAGATVRYGLTITGKRRTSRPGWGLISTFNTGHLVGREPSSDALAFSFEGRLLWPLGSTG
jgi:acyl dehydratase